MTRGLEIRAAGEGDTDAIVDLLRRSLGPAAGSDLWRWKHLNNPFGASPCLVAVAGGEVVGVRAFMRWAWRSGGAETRALRAVDTATHPDWRRRGVFSLLTQELVDRTRAAGFGFVYNTPNRLSRPQYLRLGWRRVGRVPVWLRPASVLHRRSRSERDLPPVEELLAQPGLDSLLSHRTDPDDGLRYRTPRDLRYLDWRYRQAPKTTYRALWNLSADGGAALVFRSRRRRGLEETLVAEILATPGRKGPATAAELLAELARRCGSHYLAALAPRASPERAALRRALFAPAGPVGPVLTVLPLAPDLQPDPLQWPSWACSLGDLEIF